MPGTIGPLIINGPYEEPERHWRYERESRTFNLEPGRRPAGYVVATPGSKSFDDPGVFVTLPLVNRIRPRVGAWREAGYPGVTGTTLRLLRHWRDPETWEARRFFFCQLEAIETLIWLAEAPGGERAAASSTAPGKPARHSTSTATPTSRRGSRTTTSASRSSTCSTGSCGSTGRTSWCVSGAGRCSSWR